ncbi:MAG: aldehyde dehydrogenase family protein [Rhodanobacteraceae bacterium]|nr:aldehyde dehydrogenase family protein [Rhodanobacteraceae bacterium]
MIGMIFADAADPAAIAARLAAVIASGNTVVALLPGRAGGLVAEFGEAFATSDLPGGVINLLSGDAAELGAQFGSHMEIQGLAFFGDETARHRTGTPGRRQHETQRQAARPAAGIGAGARFRRVQDRVAPDRVLRPASRPW